MGKGPPIRLNKIKSAPVPCAGFTQAGKVRRGKAGVQQGAVDVLKTLDKPGTLYAKALMDSSNAIKKKCLKL